MNIDNFFGSQDNVLAANAAPSLFADDPQIWALPSAAARRTDDGYIWAQRRTTISVRIWANHHDDLVGAFQIASGSGVHGKKERRLRQLAARDHPQMGIFLPFQVSARSLRAQSAASQPWIGVYEKITRAQPPPPSDRRSSRVACQHKSRASDDLVPGCRGIKCVNQRHDTVAVLHTIDNRQGITLFAEFLRFFFIFTGFFSDILRRTKGLLAMGGFLPIHIIYAQ
jgi:hypothetical protein